MNKLKKIKLHDARDKQTKISSFFLKSNKSEKNEILKNTGVQKSNLSIDQLICTKDVCLSEVATPENIETTVHQNKTSPLKESSNVIKYAHDKEDCRNTGNNCTSPKQLALSPKHSDQNICKKRNSIDSPDFVPPTPTIINNKKRRKNGFKRKFNFSKSDDREKECFHTNTVKSTSCTMHNDLQDGFFIHNLKLSLENNETNNVDNTQDVEKVTVNIKVNDAVDNYSVGALYTERSSSLTEIKKNELSVESDLEVVNQCELIQNSDCGLGLKSNILGKHDSTPVKNSPVKIDAFTPTKYIEMCNDNSFLEDLGMTDIEQKNALSLVLPVRCQVASLQPVTNVGELVLGLKTSKNEAFTITCVLCGTWATSKISVGDFVIVSAKPIDGQPGCWKVDDEEGSIVLHPDTLVSGTTLLGSLFCMRRSVLSDSYRGLDSDSKVMVMGSLLHTLLQEVLKKNTTTFEGIRGIVEQIMSSRKLLFTLYSSKMTLEETRAEMEAFVPQIYNFLQQYMNPEDMFCAQPQKTCGNDGWKGKITGIADIEENIWAPRLGLKGKVDVTVYGRLNSRKKVMPLELKTGCASFSAEHRGQVILYTMMMSELGQSVDSGLLLYLREGVMKEIMVGNPERRDLILLRNQFVNHLQSSKHVTYNDKDSSGTIEVANLPEPINHHSACGRCPYLTLCSSALRQKGLDQLPKSNPLKALSLTATEHLQEEHIQYVFHWAGLLSLEETENQKDGIKIQDIWLLTPKQREENGNCISNAALVGNVEEVIDGYYEHTFTWSGTRNCFPVEGEYLIVSSSNRAAVAAGTVRNVSDNLITLYLERDLSVRDENVWHLDRYESQTLLTFNLSNLSFLLDNTKEAKSLRESIISLGIPKFAPKLSSKVLKVGKDLLSSLNSGQKSAVFRSLAAEQYILIKGMPGTGKTATVVSLVLLAVRLGQTVLITSHTHSAVDNVLLRLKGKVEFLRLGSSNRLHPELIQYGENNNSCTTPEEFEAFYNTKPVVGVTCFGSGHPLLRRRKFDLCLIDEATQVLQPTVLRPLFSAKKFILVGDPDQLSPIVRSQEAKNRGLGVSLFERLDKPAVTSVLTTQYRMNETITRLANQLTYNGNLCCGSETIQNATIKLNVTMEDQPGWIKRALSSQLENSVIVLDTGDVHSSNPNCSNQFEADIVVQLINILTKGGIYEKDIGVISPYRAQVLLLKQRMSNTCVEVNTVDQYQGRDKDVIVYSCTRSSQAKESDILSDQKRMTVAITRARHKLIFIGNVKILKGYSVFKKIFTFISDSNFISVKQPESHLV